MSSQAPGRELANITSYALNTFNFDSKGFVEAMTREHRTLQQSFMREVVLPYLEALSLSNSFDDRNLASVELAKVILSFTMKIAPYF